jgi:uncharacterized 2Fe-2S/4Fe-4S cluster protein (DUF4445 family)/predicted metal-binding protein
MSWMKERILELGAEHAAQINGEEIPLDRSFRAACEQNACGYYGKCWTCPPDAGPIDQLMDRVRSFQKAIVFQTISSLEDSYDIEGMHDAAVRHNRLVQAVGKAAQEWIGTGYLLLGAGACGVCPRCAKAEGAPCRFPDKAVVSLEACGVDVAGLAKKSGLKYINGVNTVTYFGLLLYHEETRATLHVTLPDGGRREIACRRGATIAHALESAGMETDLPCSGRGICGKCRVWAEGALEAPDSLEREALGQLLAKGIRLACQARIAGDCRVLLPGEAEMQFASGEDAGRVPVRPLFNSLGAAVDIGTTTLAVQLYDHTGRIASRDGLNPQSAFGADVISRVGRALDGDGEGLKATVAGGIDALIKAAALDCGREGQTPDGLVITGNTAMLYLLTGRNPVTLSKAPFLADCLFGERVKARALGLPYEADCYLPRCMAAFVGADITTAVLASGMLDASRTALLIDVGTNGEIALWQKGTLTCCSTAAGPAFEGALLSCGCRGVLGAVDHVEEENNALHCHTIGGGSPVGVCGSGVVDALAALLRLGWVDETGRLDKPDMQKDGQDAVRLVGDVCLTQKDIRAVQLAKGAVSAGILTLLHEAGLKAEDVEDFYIAGGFGAFLNAKHAGEIGLFPQELAGKAHVLGNAALTGAVILLCDERETASAGAIASRAEHIELSVNPFFKNQYMKSMLF